MRQKQKMASANTRKRAMNGAKPDGKPRPEKAPNSSLEAKNSNIYHNVSGSFVQGSSHNPELGGSFGVILNKSKEVEVRKGGSLFSISYQRDDRFKRYTEVFDKLHTDLKEEIDKKKEEEIKINEDSRNIKKEGIYIDKDEVLIDIKKIYEFPEPPKPPTPKGFFNRKVGFGSNDLGKGGMLNDDYKTSFLTGDSNFTDISNLKTSNTYLYNDLNKLGEMKQPPDMDPEMLRLLKENQIKVGVDTEEKEEPGIYTVPSFPNQLIHPESDIQRRMKEIKEESEARVCIEDIDRIKEEIQNPSNGIPCTDTLAEIAELDLLSLNKLFEIPEYLIVRKAPREQNLLAHFANPASPKQTSLVKNKSFLSSIKDKNMQSSDKSQVEVKEEGKDANVKEEVSETEAPQKESEPPQTNDEKIKKLQEDTQKMQKAEAEDIDDKPSKEVSEEC
ncbi:unnamed protein product [Moneuplotes crassus]|uniref:Uncharacterized protein n=1 Tax=Euplotes crassus TaxID=5936 RepID=A0AAD1U178_EUPCR|nr:unnamed protein product [Moneuplotes crassus]